MASTKGATVETGGAYPMTYRCNERGHLEVGGCDLVELADTYGTPLYVYDEATLRALCREFVAAFCSRAGDATVVYAGKSFLCRAMCELVADEGLSLDVSSGGELWMARVAGFPAERIVVHGNNKTPEELRLALDMGTGRIVVDSFHEIALLERLAAQRGVRQRVLLRLAPGVAPHTHKYMQTGHEGSKFGFPLGQAAGALTAALESPHLRLTGLHFHIGSQISDLTPYEEAITILVSLIADWRQELDFVCEEVDVGGGLAIDYMPGDAAPTVAEFADLIATVLRRETDDQGLETPRLLVEPGRSICGRAGLTVYRVGSLKDVPGAPLHVSVDGGMSDNMRPMLYGSLYQAVAANKMTAPRDVDARIVGKHCESGDTLIDHTRIAAPEPGDVLVVPATGAYAHSLANNYNGQPRPAVVFARDGEARLVVQRESWADVSRLHLSLNGR